MKTIILSSLTIIALMLLSFPSYSQTHVTMRLANITSTANTIEYDLFIINDGTTALKLSACSYGVNYDRTILQQDAPAYCLVDASIDSKLTGLNKYSIASTFNDKLAHLRLTMAPTNYQQSPNLEKGTLYKIGRMKVTNASTWNKNSNPAFQLQDKLLISATTTMLIAYVEEDTKLTVMNVTNGLLRVEVEESPILLPETSSSQSMPEKANLLDAKQIIRLFPNPAVDQFQLQWNATSQENIAIRIYAMDGRLMKQIITKTEIGLFTIDANIHELANGNYTVQILQDKKVMQTKILAKHAL